DPTVCLCDPGAEEATGSRPGLESLKETPQETPGPKSTALPRAEASWRLHSAFSGRYTQTWPIWTYVCATENCNSHVLCPANAKCVNDTHCTCLDGYQTRENHPVFFTDTTEICDDIDECLGLSPPGCGLNAKCINMAGSYYCTCIDGYEPSSGKANFTNNIPSCVADIDECQGHANCTNVPGSYYCTCIDGYESSSGKANFTHASENTCQDIDECQGPSPADCGPHANCTNVPGSYHCTCIDGYEPSSGKAKFTHASENTCQDIDECQGPADCGPHANCTNEPGSYYCTCIDGYESSSGEANFTHASENTCQDIDECRKTPNICAPKATCINSNESYWCECRAGYIPSNRNTTLCEELTCPRLPDDDNSAEAKNLQGSFPAQVGRLCKAALEELKQMKAQSAESVMGQLQGFLDILEKQINLVGQQSENVERRHWIATELMATVEKQLRTLAMTLPDSTISIASTNGTELGLAVRQAGNQSQETVTLQQSKTQMELKWAGVPGQENEGFTLAGLLTYQGMSPILDGAGRVEMPKWDKIGQTGKRAQEPGRPSYRVLSPVVSAFISDPNPQALGLSVSIRFSHPVPENKTDLRLLCAYWEPDSRRWATHGCTLQNLTTTITRCQCNHLASFAVLMAFYELEGSYTLTIITYVGLTLSLLCLFLAILTFLLCRSIRSVSTSLHLQLCLCLFLADLLFLTPVTRTGSPCPWALCLPQVACAVIAGLLHYLFLACFSWMFLEGLHLFLTVRNLKVVNYTSASRFKKRFMYPFGYGFPVLVVAISAAVNPEGYETSKHCWLSPERGFRWSFLGPVCAIILINITFFALTLWILRNRLSSLNAGVSTLRDHRLLTFKAIAQLFILGCTWSLGLLQVGPAATVMAYFFTIVNSLQGAFIFLVHCLLNRQVREEYRRWIKGFRTSSTKSQTYDLSMSAVPTTSTKTDLSPITPYVTGLCIALCLGGTVAQNHGIQGTTEDCNNHVLCPANAKCVNNTHCTCLDGYQTSGNHPVFFTDPMEICDDINECQGPSRPDCGRNANCANVPGSYYCTCTDGYEPSSGKANFTNASENTCQDIDECQGPSPADCGAHANCANVPGSYYCTCIDGYEPSSGKANFTHASENTCQDIDECQRNTICEPHGNCFNMPGSYMCKCSWGFGKSQKDSSKICTDIDECRKTPDICGPNATCINTYGSYWCECRAGYVPSNRNRTLCEELTCPWLLDGDNSTEAKNLLGSFLAQMGRLCKAALEELKQMNSQNAKGKLQGFLDILEKQINLVGQQSESVEWRHQIATELMAIVEKLLRTLALTLPDSTISIASTNGTELGLAVRQAGNQNQETVTLQQSKTQMELNWTGAPGQKNEGFTLAGLLTYQGMSPILEGAGWVEGPEWNKIGQTGKQAQEPGRPSYRVLSPVVSAFISDPNPQARSLSVSIRFSHPVPENKTDLRLLCAYWEPDSRCWATDGCTLQKLNATITRCQCNHLTSFAVLMAFYELEEATLSLNIITYVGLTLSLLCLFLAILTFLLCRSIRNISTSLHLQLCLCLFLADLLFLATVTHPSSQMACAVIAGLLHYLFLACFSWMLLEGLHLFLTVRNLKVVNYTSASRFKKRFMYPFGYGFPALVVAISAAVNPDGYGTSKHCWLSPERGFRWSFLGPVCAIILINITFFVLTLWILRNSLSSLNADVSTLRDHRLLTFKAIAQLFILGCTWSLGLLQVGPAATVMAYLFTIVNSLQGAFIFLVHCLLNRQVREEYRRWIKGFRMFSTKSQTSDLSMSAVPTTSTKTE
ncbi:uncharacterized protein LOC128828471, partial [Malaclemys terrapin pileata]|uniref:uncharacterized protein LOC128828471 n=1 Tax=Malaclemys terrapin pileata TaxID=2991368 RepID=UPI0023A88E68